MQEQDRKPLFKHAQIVKLARLLDMLYKPAELARELGVTSDTIYRSYIPAGAPHQRDAKRNIWIHGLTFRQWADENIKAKKNKRASMPEGKAWCMRCKQAVDQINPKPKPINRYLELMQSKCPNCGGIVNRARGRQRSDITTGKATPARRSSRSKSI